MAKTPKEKFEYRMRKDSVEKDVFVILKPKKNWEQGLTVIKLKQQVELNLINKKKKKKTFSKGRIYEAISLLNRYGGPYGIYIRSAYGFTNLVKEYRYFVPTEQFDIDDEKKDLERRNDIVIQKRTNLEHHEKITIPQEKQLVLIREHK